MRKLISLIALLALATGAGAQNRFWADLDGAQMSPPVDTFAGGWARVTLNANNTLSFGLRVYGMVGTKARVHTGAPGVEGPILLPLAGGPTIFTGTTLPLSAAQVAELRADGLYFKVHSAAFPDGQVRGQIEVRPRTYAAWADGAQEVPASGATGVGSGRLVLTVAGELDYDLSASGLTGTPVNSHLHLGGAGVNGPAFATLGAGTSWLGKTAPLTLSQHIALQNSATYWNVQTAAFASGEIRGQVVAEGHRYGNLAQFPITLDSTGAPVDGASISIDIAGGKPNSAGFLLVALAPDAQVLNNEAFLLSQGSILLADLVLPLDAAGDFHSTTTLPPLFGASFDLYLQFFNLDTAAPNGQYTVSNGLRLPLFGL